MGGLALLVSLLVGASLALRIARGMPASAIGLATLVGSLIGGWVLADLLSGLFHYWADERADECMPFLGRNVIVPFREHHADPRAITRHDLSETNGDNALGALLVLGPLLAWVPAAPTPSQLALSALGLGLGLGVLVTNQVHQWAHARHAPRAVRWLQRRGLLLSPAHHARHHRAHDRAYCITAGWCNVLLDRVLPRAPRATDTPQAHDTARAPNHHAHRRAITTPHGAPLEQTRRAP